MKQYDSLIFDMDGTLWDAVDSYAHIWNVTAHEFNITLNVSRDQLLQHMGSTLDVIAHAIVGDIQVDFDRFLERLDYHESALMATLGGTLYPGVREGLAALSQRYPIYLVSNCGKDGLHNMLTFTGLTPYVAGTLTYGETGKPKKDNIKQVIDSNNLSAPLYIGDTQGDSNAAHAAGAHMCHVTWGFGECNDAELSFDSFPSMVESLLR